MDIINKNWDATYKAIHANTANLSIDGSKLVSKGFLMFGRSSRVK